MRGTDSQVWESSYFWEGKGRRPKKYVKAFRFLSGGYVTVYGIILDIFL